MEELRQPIEIGPGGPLEMDNAITRLNPAKKNSKFYCQFHKKKGHDTEDCFQLKGEIEKLIRQGYLKEFIAKQEGKKHDECSPRKRRSKSQTRELVNTIDVANFAVYKVLVDIGSSADIIFKNASERMGLHMTDMKLVNTSLMGFGGGTIAAVGVISFPTSFGADPCQKTMMVR
ncbi:hypothetical protein Sango_3032900 [Sesamum angolense]|uniref:Peptidase A2 domain-containing protein n=1 Tax=Sesamum angolense TaxID=2727404 RepID=A0AAE1T9I2_9LAMI|nr:hypothetical protein Sango_3032900 [Sesamum angolense]